MSMTLRYYWRSSASHRVRIALALKGIDLAYVPVDPLKSAQRGPDHLPLNPLGAAPVLVDGDLVLGQSLAIISYLDDLQPEPLLLPLDPAARAHSLQIAYDRDENPSAVQPLSSFADQGAWQGAGQGRLEPGDDHDRPRRRGAALVQAKASSPSPTCRASLISALSRNSTMLGAGSLIGHAGRSFRRSMRRAESARHSPRLTQIASSRCKNLNQWEETI